MRHTTSTVRAPGTSTRRSALALLMFAAGLSLFVVAIARAGVSEIRAQLLHVGPRAFWLLLPYAFGTAIGALPWAALLPRVLRPRPLGVVVGRFVASSANALLPLFGLAGEPTRLLWLRPQARARGLAAIVIDRVLYNCSNGCLLLVGAAVALEATRLPTAVALGATAAALATVIITLALLLGAVRFGVGRRVQALLRRVLGKVYTPDAFGAEVDAALLVTLREQRFHLVVGVVTHMLGRATILGEVFVALRLLGVASSPADAVVLAVVPIGLSLFFSSIPSQLGVQEGGQALVAAALGMSPSVGVTLVLLQRFRQLVFAAFAPLLLEVGRSRRVTRATRP
jgi:hypothetical protein